MISAAEYRAAETRFRSGARLNRKDREAITAALMLAQKISIAETSQAVYVTVKTSKLITVHRE